MFIVISDYIDVFVNHSQNYSIFGLSLLLFDNLCNIDVIIFQPIQLNHGTLNTLTYI